MDRPSALALMQEYTASLSLRRHMLAVEAANAAGAPP
jgi:predicted hydrolase (HD superfamily)